MGRRHNDGLILFFLDGLCVISFVCSQAIGVFLPELFLAQELLFVVESSFLFHHCAEKLIHMLLNADSPTT